MNDYKYKLKKYLKNEYKIANKKNITYSDKIKKEIDILIDNSDDDKLEILYKYKCVIFNSGITISELDDIYKKLFRKILFTDNNSLIFTNDWDNIFRTIFGNIPAIYMKHGKEIINKLVDSFYITKNEQKLKLLIILFKTIYHIDNEDLKYVDSLLSYINKTEEDYILKSYETIIENLSSMCDNVTFKRENIEKIFELSSQSKSAFNAEHFSNMVSIFNDYLIENDKLYELFELISVSNNKKLVEAIMTLLEKDNFRELQNNIQNRCINILKNVEEINVENLRLITKIILEIIVCTDEKIQEFLLDKLEIIKNPESLQLILKLTPLLNEFIDDEEYIRVVDSIEDKEKNIIKKLVINLNYNE